MSSAKRKNELLNLFYLVSVVLLLLLSMLNIQNLSHKKNLKVLGISAGQDLTEIKNKINYWEELVSKNPTYYDGWIELYKLNLNLGDYTSALKAYEVAKRIDFNR